MPNMKLYMTPGSCSTAIHIILEELDAVFEAHIVNLPAGEHLQAAYVTVNPKSAIPALLRPDGSVLTEVQAIAFWLGRTQGRGKFWPATIDAETRALELMAYVTCTVHGQGFARIFATTTFMHDATAAVPVKQLVQQQGRDIVNAGFSILNAALGGREYVAETFSVADAVLFYVEFWADKLDIPLPVNLLSHYRRVLARPAVQRVLREEGYNLLTLGQHAQPGTHSPAYTTHRAQI